MKTLVFGIVITMGVLMIQIVMVSKIRLMFVSPKILLVLILTRMVVSMTRIMMELVTT